MRDTTLGTASRAKAEGLAVQFVEADAEALPFPDASFDAVLSVVGVMFAPDQQEPTASRRSKRMSGCTRSAPFG